MHRRNKRNTKYLLVSNACSLHLNIVFAGDRQEKHVVRSVIYDAFSVFR